MNIWTLSVWSQGGKEVPSESPMRQADMASSSVTLTPSFSALHISCFPLSHCFVHCIHFVIFSAPSCFLLVLCVVLFYSVFLWSVFFSCTELCLILLFTVLLYCPQLNKGNMSLYWQLILCVRLCLRRFLSRGSFRNKNTELKVQADEYSTGRNRQADRKM